MASPGSDFVRPDILEARAIPSKVKEKLVYKDDDELDTGMQKVQPLPFLDEEILKFKQQIESAKDTTTAKGIEDDVPEKVLTKVDHVITVATDGKTTLFKASELLEFTMEPFQYARRSAQDDFDLSRRSAEALKSYDHSFTEMMKSRLEANMSSAAVCEEECLSHLNLAIKEAERDCQMWAEHLEGEERQLESLGKLEEIKIEVKDSIRDEITELEMIRDQCVKDASIMDSELNLFKAHVEKTTQAYKSEESRKRRQLEENRKEQERLRQRLAQLETEEGILDQEIALGAGQEEESGKAKQEAADNIGSWKEKVEELKERSKTSLRVMKEMSEVTDLILSDAQQKQRGSKDKLARLELESLQTKRDVLMAQGVMYKLTENESQTNIKNAESELVQLKKELKVAARSGFQLKVSKINENLENYKEAIAQFEEKLKEAKSHLERITKELAVVDARLMKLNPRLKLDRLEERYSHRHSLMEKAFNNESVEGVEFNSRGRY